MHRFFLCCSLVFVSCVCGPRDDADTCSSMNGVCTPDGGATNCVSFCGLACSTFDDTEACSTGCVIEAVPTQDRAAFLATRRLSAVVTTATSVAVCRERSTAISDGGP